MPQNPPTYAPPPTPDPAHAVVDLLRYAGEDPDRQGLRETPERFARAWFEEWTAGYRQDPAEVLKAFEDGGEDYSGMLFQGGIPVYSHCEHHIALIWGFAYFAYIPRGKVVGLSKIKRLIDVYARRLQVQERLTAQIADSFVEHVECAGCAVRLELRHACMESRGVGMVGVPTVTTELRGIFLEDASTQAEFIREVQMARSRA